MIIEALMIGISVGFIMAPLGALCEWPLPITVMLSAGFAGLLAVIIL